MPERGRELKRLNFTSNMKKFHDGKVGDKWGILKAFPCERGS